MNKYRYVNIGFNKYKRGAIEEAIQWDGEKDSLKEIKKLNAHIQLSKTDDKNATLLIETLEEVDSAELGDWIIQNGDGELYTIKNDIFVKTYKKVEQ